MKKSSLAMVEEQLNYKFSKCSVGDLVSMPEPNSEDSALSLNKSGKSHISSLKNSSCYYENIRSIDGARTVALNKSYTISNVKSHLPAIIEVSCEQSLNSVMLNSAHFDNFNAETFLPSENLNEIPCLQAIPNAHDSETNSVNCSDSDDSLGIISDLVNDSDGDHSFFDLKISDFKPFHSAPLFTYMHSAAETKNCELPFVNEDAEIESPVSSCFKHCNRDLFENENSPIPNLHVPMFASTPNHAFTKKLIDNLNFEVPPHLICHISPDSVCVSVTRISKDEPDGSKIDVLKNCNNQGENCTSVLNATYGLNCNITDIKQENVFIANELCARESVPDRKCSLNGTYDCSENSMAFKIKLDSPPKNLETNNSDAQRITSGAEKVCAFDKTQVLHTYSTQSNCDMSVLVSLKQHSPEFEEVECVPDLQNNDSPGQKDFQFPNKSNSSQKDKANAVNCDLSATISLPIDFSLESKIIGKPRNTINNRKGMLPLSHCIAKPNRSSENKKEKILQNSCTVSKKMKLPANHAASFMREKSSSFKNYMSISKMKAENPVQNDLNVTASLSDKLSSKSKNSISNPQTIVKKSIQLSSVVNAKKTEAAYDLKLQRRFSASSVNVQKPSYINLNSTMLIDKTKNNKILEKGLMVSHQHSKNSKTLNDKHLLEVCISKPANSSSFNKEVTSSQSKNSDTALLCQKNSLSSPSYATKSYSASAFKNPMLSSKRMSVTNKPTICQIKRASSSISNASVTDDGKLNHAKNSICKFKRGPNRSSLSTQLNNTTIMKSVSSLPNSTKGHKNYSNNQKEGKDIRCISETLRVSKENSDPNVSLEYGLKGHQKIDKIPKGHKPFNEKSEFLAHQDLNVSSIKIVNDEKYELSSQKCVQNAQRRKSFLPVAKRTLAKAKVNVPRIGAENSEGIQRTLKRNQSTIQKLQPLQYKRCL